MFLRILFALRIVVRPEAAGCCLSRMGRKCYRRRGTVQRGMNHTYAPICLTAPVIDWSEGWDCEPLPGENDSLFKKSCRCFLVHAGHPYACGAAAAAVVFGTVRRKHFVHIRVANDGGPIDLRSGRRAGVNWVVHHTSRRDGLRSEGFHWSRQSADSVEGGEDDTGSPDHRLRGQFNVNWPVFGVLPWHSSDPPSPDGQWLQPNRRKIFHGKTRAIHPEAVYCWRVPATSASHVGYPIMKSTLHFTCAPLAALSFLLSFLSVATAQNYSIDWFTIDGGAGMSTGGPYSLTGTIGQSDANQQVMTGGNFSLSGGFWSLVAVQTDDAPPLRIQFVTTDTARIFWPSSSEGFVLQQNTNLNNVSISGWVSAPQPVTDDGTSKFVIVNPPTGNRFYRLFKP